MKKSTAILTGILLLVFSSGNTSGNENMPGQSTLQQAGSKSAQTKQKTQQAVKKPAQQGKSTQTRSKQTQKVTKAVPEKKSKEAGIVRIGKQSWAVANLDVRTFQNGDSIPEAKTNKDWVAAGDAKKPAWCYYNNDPAIGKKYGKLYNWYAVNDPRGLAPAGWAIPNDEDWSILANFLGGQSKSGTKLKSATGWSDDNNGTNESGFSGFPAGYRIENGLFQNLGSIGIWWSTNESKSLEALNHYLVLGGSFNKSSNPKQRGESVRCLRK